VQALRQRTTTRTENEAINTLVPTHTPVAVRTPPPRTVSPLRPDSYFPPEPEEVGPGTAVVDIHD